MTTTPAPAPTAVAAAPPRAKLTSADYRRLTPPVPDGARYQLINGELIAMAGASDAHQVFNGRLYIRLTLQVDELGIGETRIAPYDVELDESNTYQPDLLFVSNARRHIFDRDGHGITGAPDVVVEILSDSTRRHDLARKLPNYLRAGVREVVIVDLDARTVAVYDQDSAAPSRTFAAADTLTLNAMPGVAIPLAPIFARALGTP